MNNIILIRWAFGPERVRYSTSLLSACRALHGRSDAKSTLRRSPTPHAAAVRAAPFTAVALLACSQHLTPYALYTVSKRVFNTLNSVKKCFIHSRSAQVSDPTSPQYGQHLTAAQVRWVHVWSGDF